MNGEMDTRLITHKSINIFMAKHYYIYNYETEYYISTWGG